MTQEDSGRPPSGPGCQPTASASLCESSRSGIPDARKRWHVVTYFVFIDNAACGPRELRRREFRWRWRAVNAFNPSARGHKVVDTAALVWDELIDTRERDN